MKFLLSWAQQYNILAIALFLLISPTLKAAEKELPESISGSITIDAEELIALANKTEALILIDARLRSDHEQGFIEGSINLPNTITSCNRLKEYANHENVPLIFYCNGPKCDRSLQAVQIALQCNYQNIYWFRGGMDEWKNKHYPYIKQ